MHKSEKKMIEDRYKYPSFASSILDEVYRSICEEDGIKGDNLKFYGETKYKKPMSKDSGSVKISRAAAAVTYANEKEKREEQVCRASLIEKWMDKKVIQKSVSLKHDPQEFERNSQHDHDALFFSSTSNSSDSSFCGFSSFPDTESTNVARSKGCSWPNPVRTRVLAGSRKTETNLFHEQRELQMLDDYHYNSITGHTPRLEKNIFKSKSSKYSPSTMEKLRNGDKGSVRFYDVSGIVDEDGRHCKHKSLYAQEEEEIESALMSVSMETSWEIGKSPSSKVVDELNYQVMEKSGRVEQVAREFLKDYHHNQKENNDDAIMKDVRCKYNDHFKDEDDDNEDDDASCSSSDLFELDHL